MIQLTDKWGRPIDKAVLIEEQAAPAVTGVRRPNIEHQASGLTPDKLARLLRQSLQGNPEAYLELAEDMEERDLHYAGVLASRKRQVAGLEITVEAASDQQIDQDNADMIRAFIDRDAFEDEIIDILDAIGKGFSATEIIWDTSESQWQPVALKWRDPRWFTFDQADGETPLLRDLEGPVPLAPFKWVFHCAKVKSGLPIRGGIARAVSWTFLFKSFTTKDWAIFCEAYGQPLRLGKYDSNAKPEDKEVLLKAVQNIGVDYAAIIPESMAVEIIQSQISGNHELYKSRADWLDQQVSKIVLGQTGTTDAIAGGYAVGKVHDGVKEDIERSDARQLAATLNRDLVRPYIDLNKGPQKAYPRIKIGRGEEIDLEKFMSNVQTFVSLGGKVGMSFVRDKLGIEDPGKEEELLSAGGTPTDPTAAIPVPAEVPPLAAAKRSAQSAVSAPPATDAIDASIAAMIADSGFEPLVAEMTDGLQEKLSKSSDEASARQVLADHFKAMDVSAMADLLARATFSAMLAGLGNDKLSDEV